jgi:hypothetical protein
MSTPLHGLEDTVRTQIHLIHEADPVAGGVIAAILKAADKYAQSRVEAEARGNLFEVLPSSGMVLGADQIIGAIRNIREPLLAVLPKGNKESIHD